MHTSRGCLGRSRQSANRESNGTWGTCLHQGPWAECFRISRQCPDWPIQTKRIGFSKGHIRHIDPGRQGRQLPASTVGEVIARTTLACDSVCCHVGHIMAEGTRANLRPHRPLGQTKWMSRLPYDGKTQLNSQQMSIQTKP